LPFLFSNESQSSCHDATALQVAWSYGSLASYLFEASLDRRFGHNTRMITISQTAKKHLKNIAIAINISPI